MANKATVDMNPKKKEAYSLMLQGFGFNEIAEKMSADVSSVRNHALDYESVYGDVYFVRYEGWRTGKVHYEIFRAGSVERARKIIGNRFGKVNVLEYGRAENELSYVENRIEQLGSELAELRLKRRALKARRGRV